MPSSSGDFNELTYVRGRVGLAAVLRALGIGPQDEVATQAFTCVAVPEAIMAVGATPLYIDIKAGSVNMDVDSLAARISKKTRALVIQHTFGIPADIEPLLATARRNDLTVIEDCCHTLSSLYRGRPVGSFGAASFYSFEWGKPLIIGMGGSLLVNDPALAKVVRDDYPRFHAPPFVKQARLLMQYLGYRAIYRPGWYWPVREAFHRLGRLGLAESNYNPVASGAAAHPEFSMKMSRLHRIMLSRQLGRLDHLTRVAREVAEAYREGIVAPGVRHPTRPADSETVFARYPLLVKDKERWLLEARHARVELSNWYATPIHPLRGRELNAVHYEEGSCPVAETTAGQVVSLPVNGRVGQRDIEKAVGLFARGRA